MTSEYDRRTFFLCWLVTYLGQAYLSMFFLYPVALQRQGIPLALSGWLMSIFSVGSMLMRPAGSILNERLGVRKSLLYASVFLFCCSMPLLFFRSFNALLVARGLMGLFYGVVMLAVTTYQALSIPEERRGSLYAWIAVAYVLPQLSIVPLSEFLISSISVQAFLALAPAVAAATFLISKNLPKLKNFSKESKVNSESGSQENSLSPDQDSKGAFPASSQQWGSWGEMVRVKGFWPLVLTLLTWSFVNTSTLQYMPAFIRSRGLIASSFVAANAGVSLSLRLFATRFMDLIDRRTGAALAITLMGAVVVGTRFAFSNHSFFLLGLIYGLGMGLGFPMILALMPDVFPERLRPKGIAIGTLLMESGFIFTPFIISYGGGFFGLGNVMAFIGVTALAGGFFLSLHVWRKA